jgi:hypothetical protein
VFLSFIHWMFQKICEISFLKIYPHPTTPSFDIPYILVSPFLLSLTLDTCRTNITRVRRIKCDEGKPACDRCSSTGRICDFSNHFSTSFSTGDNSSRKADLLITDHSPKFSAQKFVLRPKPYPSAPFPPQEVTHFDYFRLVCVRNFSGYFENRLWESLFLQLSHSEQSIRHAVVAIGALYRQIVHQSYDSGEEASIYYGKAQKVLNQRLGNSDSSWEIALFGSILFMVFEVLRGSDVGALKHLEGALRLMKESITRFPVSDYLPWVLGLLLTDLYWDRIFQEICKN